MKDTISEPASQRRRSSRSRRRLRVSYDGDIDFLWVVEFGEVVDGRLPDETREPVPDFFVWRRGPRGRVIGFGIDDLFEEFDPDLLDHIGDVGELRFDVPMLGLRDVRPAEIVPAAMAALRGFSTPDVVFFDEAIAAGERGELDDAAMFWFGCLACGEMKAHFGLGYTLFDLGRHHEAYGHLRAYTEINPRNAWAWSWFGRAAEAIGETGEAERAYRKAIALEAAGSFETDAPELLEELRRGRRSGSGDRRGQEPGRRWSRRRR